ncbi:hypothetical protein ANANG_G00271810 [Anguilla anguilla]|uniref:Uncharacterized protein n=1 Tax=Anguilla anguilla TaxID=7936 RepID=A0A0E9WM70_ANGAN|nr:hypothetical protein ANANG_G00271810 [Anguilla anguilla]
MLTAKAVISTKAVKGCNYCIYSTTAPRSPGIAISPADVPDTGWAVDRPSSNQTRPALHSLQEPLHPKPRAPQGCQFPLSQCPAPSTHLQSETATDAHRDARLCIS